MEQKISKDDVVKKVNRVQMPSVRSGKTHPFTDLWMVTMDGRIFARSSEMMPGDSWYDAFTREPEGAIKLKDTIVLVRAKKPDDLDSIHRKVNWAYLKKYGLLYPLLVGGVLTKKLQRRTMEFIYE